jgi:hypothetical protein
MKESRPLREIGQLCQAEAREIIRTQAELSPDSHCAIAS